MNSQIVEWMLGLHSEHPGQLREGTLCDVFEGAGEQEALEWGEPVCGSHTSEGLVRGEAATMGSERGKRTPWWRFQGAVLVSKKETLKKIQLWFLSFFSKKRDSNYQCFQVFNDGYRNVSQGLPQSLQSRQRTRETHLTKASNSRRYICFSKYKFSDKCITKYCLHGVSVTSRRL